MIAIPLLAWFKDRKRRGKLFDIVVDLNLNFGGGLRGAREAVEARIHEIIRTRGAGGKQRTMSISVVDKEMEEENVQYVFATLDAQAIKALARPDSGQPPEDSGHPPHLAGLSAAGR